LFEAIGSTGKAANLKTELFKSFAYHLPYLRLIINKKDMLFRAVCHC